MRTKLGQDARKAKEEIQNALSNLREDSQKEHDELKEKLECMHQKSKICNLYLIFSYAAQRKYWEGRLEDIEHELSGAKFQAKLAVTLMHLLTSGNHLTIHRLTPKKKLKSELQLQWLKVPTSSRSAWVSQPHMRYVIEADMYAASFLLNLRITYRQ